jgi:hypothetical protein
MMLKYLWGGGDKYLASQYCCQAVLWNYYVFFFILICYYISKPLEDYITREKKLKT